MCDIKTLVILWPNDTKTSCVHRSRKQGVHKDMKELLNKKSRKKVASQNQRHMERSHFTNRVFPRYTNKWRSDYSLGLSRIIGGRRDTNAKHIYGACDISCNKIRWYATRHDCISSFEEMEARLVDLEKDMALVKGSTTTTQLNNDRVILRKLNPWAEEVQQMKDCQTPREFQMRH